jgi:hypothetical protein
VIGTIFVFQAWLSNLISGLLGAIVGGILSYFGAIKGGKIASSTAVALQKADFAARERASHAEEKAVVRSAVQSLSDEIEALWKQYNKEIGPHLGSDIEAARAFPVRQSYFVIFDASGALVGRIPNPGLRSKILDFYIGAKSMVDSLQYYANLNAYYTTLQKDHPNILAIWEELKFYTQQLRKAHNELLRLHEDVRQDINRFLSEGVAHSL